MTHIIKWAKQNGYKPEQIFCKIREGLLDDIVYTNPKSGCTFIKEDKVTPKHLEIIGKKYEIPGVLQYAAEAIVAKFSDELIKDLVEYLDDNEGCIEDLKDAVMKRHELVKLYGN